MKKFFLMMLLSVVFVALPTINTTAMMNINHTEVEEKLTREQKRILKMKQDELKQKYLTNWKNKTEQEKKEALNAYKEELDEFCEEYFGLNYHELREKYYHYFKRIQPR